MVRESTFMPAAELTRLRYQINQLIFAFDDPALFCRRLGDLLDLYGNHAYRAGQGVQPQPILPCHRVPALVMRQLEMELGKTCREQPQLAMEVVAALWKEAYLEPRLLATSLLGAVPVPEYGAAVLQRLREWAIPKENRQVLTALLEHGTLGLRRGAPDQLLALIEHWVGSASAAQQTVGLQALIPLIQDRAFENLPPIFSMLSPIMPSISATLQTELQIVMRALIKRSPVEAAYFLRQALSVSVQPSTARLVRHCLPEFGPEQQASLRAALLRKNL